MRDDVSHYRALITDQLLKGYKPEILLVNADDEIFLSVKDISELFKLSPERIRGLVREERLIAIKPGGHDLFISVASANQYITEGRKTAGRPPSNSSE